ncbi:MAG TPA: APC family permease [Candidatus Eremiobacteraceae bacterium]|nr:APC family permease [Candidatus Eremiobacteraceae bacterium]
MKQTRSAIKKAGLLYFVFVMFSYTTGGPFGLEEMVTTSGPGMTLLYLLVIPLFWCIPVSLVAAELTTAIPVEGGFYRWVRASYGNFWGFLTGWWNWSASWLLGASYAVLFTDYLATYFPALVGWKHYLVSLALIALFAYINIRGIQMVGMVATILEFSVLAPVAVLCAIAAAKWRYNPFHPIIPPHVPPFQVFGVGLALGLWLYSGYEQCSSVAEEIENPQRNYPRAVAIVVPLSIAAYFLPALFSLAALGNWQQWNTAYLTTAAKLIAGGWMGFVMTIAAILCTVSLLNATILTSTRMPSTMSEDGYLPPVFADKHPKYGTPWIAILISSTIYALLAFHTIAQLLTVYVWLRILVTILTVLAAWRLRRSHPQMNRPFRIPWGKAGLAYVVIAPLLMSIVAFIGSDRFALKWGPIPVLAGILAYSVFPKIKALVERADHANYVKKSSKR